MHFDKEVVQKNSTFFSFFSFVEQLIFTMNLQCSGNDLCEILQLKKK